MGKNTSIALGDHFEAYIQKQLESGRYASASEVIRAALRLLEAEEQQILVLRDALIAGEESGKPRPFTNSAFKSRMKKNRKKDE